ncbi:hypothetical protein D3C73_1156130 [compost metagenome]
MGVGPWSDPISLTSRGEPGCIDLVKILSHKIQSQKDPTHSRFALCIASRYISPLEHVAINTIENGICIFNTGKHCIGFHLVGRRNIQIIFFATADSREAYENARI